jgi:hypothetical protein
MGLTFGQTVLWYSAFSLEVLVCAFALRRRLYVHLPIFTVYLFLLIARAIFIYIVYRAIGYASHFAFYSYWISEGTLLSARAASIAELIWNASRGYAGLRAILKWVLGVTTALLLIQAASAAITHASRIPSFVLTLEQSLELAAAVALVVLLGVTRFYEVPLQRLQTLLATGLLFYSVVQVANNAITKYGMESHFHWWEAVRSTSFCVALLIWFMALAKPLRVEAREELQLPEDLQNTRNLMRQGLQLLRELLERLHHVNRETER